MPKDPSLSILEDERSPGLMEIMGKIQAIAKKPPDLARDNEESEYESMDQDES